MKKKIIDVKLDLINEKNCDIEIDLICILK